jgi:hypothetical protein
MRRPGQANYLFFMEGLAVVLLIKAFCPSLHQRIPQKVKENLGSVQMKRCPKDSPVRKKKAMGRIKR